MNIIIDENIEFGQEAFRQFGEVRKIHGRKITNEILRECEVLVVRSITNVNKSLLEGTPVKFVGTTTIGTDHLELDYLNEKGIKFSSAPGCNSFAVAEYVLSALYDIATNKKIELKGKSLGVVGYGNIGKKVTKFAKAIGMNVLVNDPPLQREGYHYNFSSINEILECDLITLHVPMNKTGVDKTFHLIDDERIDKLEPGTVLINTCRGAVVDNEAMLTRLKSNSDLIAVLDVWENEPIIKGSLLDLVYLASPHIAGYSLEGKVNGTVMIYDELCKFTNETAKWQPMLPDVENSKIQLDPNLSDQELLSKITSHIYPIARDSESIKKLKELDPDSRAKEFDKLRKNYNLRREFDNFSVDSKHLSDSQKNILAQLRLSVQ